MEGLSLSTGSSDTPVPVQNLPIPDRLNAGLVAIDFAAAVALLWAATVCIGIAVLAWLVLRPMSAASKATNLQSDPIPLTGA